MAPLPPTRAAADPAAAAAAGASLTVVDYRSQFARSAPADAAGIATVEFGPVPSGLLWLVQRMRVMTNSATASTLAVYAGPVDDSNMVDGTIVGNQDTADEASPILVDSNLMLTLQWTGATPGAIGTARIQHQVVQRA